MNRKLWLLIVVPLILSLFMASVNASGIFGYIVKGPSYGTLTNRIKGSKYYLSEKAYAQSITVYLKMNDAGGSGKVRCAIYSTSLTLLATTQELDIAQDFDGWKTFSFSSPPLLNVGNYWLVAWGNTPVTGEFRIYKTSGSPNQQLYQIETYTGNFPDPLGEGEYFGYYDYKMSIYCTYNLWSENGNGEEEGPEPDIDITLLPQQLANALTIDLFPAQILLSSLILIGGVVLPLTLLKAKGILIVIVGFVSMCSLIALGWLPFWILLLVGFLGAIIVASKIKGMI